MDAESPTPDEVAAAVAEVWAAVVELDADPRGRLLMAAQAALYPEHEE